MNVPGSASAQALGRPFLEGGGDGVLSAPADVWVTPGSWLFVPIALLALALLPACAGLLRRGLLPRRRPVHPLESVSFGSSQKAHRSPRHAVLLHRGLVGSMFTALVALMLIPAAASLTALGGAAVPTAIVFVLPTLLVTLHARRKSPRE